MSNQALSFRQAWFIWVTGHQIAQNRPFRVLSMQDHTSPSSLDNAIALQKFGVGQPVRRKEDDTLVRGKGKYTDDFNLPGQAYAWIVRSSHAHGIIRGIDALAAEVSMPRRTPWAWLDRTIQAKACRGRLKSSVYLPLPRTSVSSSLRRTGCVILLAADRLSDPIFLQCNSIFQGGGRRVILH